MENRNGLAVAATVTHAAGTGEREVALEMAEALPDGATLGADKAYDVEAFVNDLKTRNILTQLAINGAVSKTRTMRKTAVPDDAAASDG
tara:strand:+ start:154 stop:420 length:267 start_codon:yes stop_codon:yes gene_type:complete